MLIEPQPTCYTNEEGLNQLIEKNKEKYQEELIEFMIEKEEYEYFTKKLADKIQTREVIEYLTTTKPTKIWAISRTSNLGYYCNTCNKIYYNHLNCEHEKIDLKENELIKKFYFKANSKYQELSKKLGSIFYELDII